MTAVFSITEVMVLLFHIVRVMCHLQLLSRSRDVGRVGRQDRGLFLLRWRRFYRRAARRVQPIGQPPGSSHQYAYPPGGHRASRFFIAAAGGLPRCYARRATEQPGRSRTLDPAEPLWLPRVLFQGASSWLSWRRRRHAPRHPSSRLFV